MSTLAETSLAIIALATLTMALVQVGTIVYGWTVARRISRLIEQLERDVKPLTDNLNAVARDAARATSMAVAQVERVDRIFTTLTDTLEQTASTVQRSIVAPLREGTAVMAGLRAAMEFFLNLNRSSRSKNGRTDEEDAMFIG